MNSYFVFFKSDDTLSRWLLLYMPLDPGSVADTKLYYGYQLYVLAHLMMHTILYVYKFEERRRFLANEPVLKITIV